MAQEKRKTTPPKPVFDVARPGKSTPTTTAKPVIVTNRPVLKDPMMATEVTATSAQEAPILPAALNSGRISIKPLHEEIATATPGITQLKELPVEGEKAAVTEARPLEAEAIPPTMTIAEAEARAQSSKPLMTPDVPEPATPSSPLAVTPAIADNSKTSKPELAPGSEQELKQLAAQDAAVDKLIETRQYFLPINSREKRRAKRLALVGLALSLILATAWMDVALDAGLIHIGHLKPLTHFFSN